MTAANLIDKLLALRLRVRVQNLGDRTRITVYGVKSEAHPRPETVEIDLGSDGQILCASKYAYLLPESVGDEVRLA